MSLDVTAMVKSGRVEHPECILCGTCADLLPEACGELRIWKELKPVRTILESVLDYFSIFFRYRDTNFTTTFYLNEPGTIILYLFYCIPVIREILVRTFPRSPSGF